jgi:peptidoglycan/xylan/chitin deacetylase (PgdA/CDA1 family)
VNLAADKGGKPLVSLTFDDGYADNHQIAAAMLAEAGLRATLFVTTGLVGTDQMLWFDRAAAQWRRSTATDRQELAALAAPHGGGADTSSFAAWMAFLKRCDPAARARIVSQHPEKGAATAGCELMTVEQVRDLHRRGHEIGSHTVSHPLLPQQNDGDLQDELAQSRERLREWLGEPVAGIAFPNGDCDVRVVAAAESAGYRYGCATQRGRNRPGWDRMRLKRIHMDPRRVTTASGEPDEVGFRSELCLLEGRWH